jgi:hypothetical protein
MTPMFMRIVVDFNFKPLGTHSYNIYMIIYIHLFIYLCICQQNGNWVCLETSGDADSWPYLKKKRVPSPSEIRSSQDFSLWESVAFPPETCKIAIITQRRFQKNEAYNPLFMVV